MRALCLFDLDGTLTRDRTLDRLLPRRGPPLGQRTADMEESVRVMQGFAGYDHAAFQAACHAYDLHPDAPRVVHALVEMGVHCAIATASYREVAEHVAQALGIDVAACLTPEVQDGRLTGTFHATTWEGSCGRPVCKAEVLREWGAQHPGAATVAVGDGSNDVCMLEAADLGIAVVPAHPHAAASADHVVPLGEVPRLVAAALRAASGRADGPGEGDAACRPWGAPSGTAGSRSVTPSRARH